MRKLIAIGVLCLSYVLGWNGIYVVVRECIE